MDEARRNRKVKGGGQQKERKTERKKERKKNGIQENKLVNVEVDL